MPHGARPGLLTLLSRTATRSLALVLFVLQILAPWLHAHLAVSRTTGFHMHVATAPGPLLERSFQPELQPVLDDAARFLVPGDEASVGMPGSWLRNVIDAVVDANAPRLAQRPAPAADRALVLRKWQLDAARPPPPLALVAYASQAPPAVVSSPMTRG